MENMLPKQSSRIPCRKSIESMKCSWRKKVETISPITTTSKDLGHCGTPYLRKRKQKQRSLSGLFETINLNDKIYRPNRDWHFIVGLKDTSTSDFSIVKTPSPAPDEVSVFRKGTIAHGPQLIPTASQRYVWPKRKTISATSSTGATTMAYGFKRQSKP